MNQSSDAAEQIVKMSLEGAEVALKVTGSGAKNLAVLLYTIMQQREQTSGKAKLSNMLKSGKPLTVFSVKREDLAKFQEEAKRYGILYCALIDKKEKAPDGLIDIVVRKEDAGRINRIVERFKLASYNKAEIISDIEKTKNSNKNKINPKYGKAEKSPLSKPTSNMQKNSVNKGALDKPSVKRKLKEYTDIAKISKEKSAEKIKISKKKKEKSL